MGQSHGSSAGGDIVIEAGTGVVNGIVQVGPQSQQVRLGSVSRTTTVVGNLVANTASVTGLIRAPSVPAASMTATMLTAGSVSVQSMFASDAVTAAHFTTTGSLTADAGITTSGILTAVSGYTGGPVTAMSAAISGDLTVSGSAYVLGTVQLGDATSLFTLGRRVATAAGRSTYILGQGAGISSVGGDLVLEAGLAGTNGNLRLGRLASSIEMGHVARTTTVNGALVANTVTSTGLLSGSALSMSGPVTAASLSTTGSATVAGTVVVAGGITLGSNAAYTITRADQTNAVRGSNTYVLGQFAGHAASQGGDILLDAGTGAAGGVVRIGTTTAASVSVASVGRTTSVLGPLAAGQGLVVSGGSLTTPTLQVDGHVTTASITTGAITGSSVTASGVVTAGGFSTGGPLTANGISNAGSFTAAAFSTAGTLTAAAVTLSADITVTGTAMLTGTLLLSNDAKYTIARPAKTTNGGSSASIGSGGWHSCLALGRYRY